MIKKIKDLTEEEQNNICDKHSPKCEKCPLCICTVLCAKRVLNREVEIDDD